MSLYVPPTVNLDGLDILSNPYFGGEFNVYYTHKPAIHLLTINQAAKGFVVKYASTANVAALTGLATPVDTAALTAGDRVLLKNQTTAKDNGIWVVGSGAWTRATDADSGDELTVGSIVHVTAGTANANKRFKHTTTGFITIGVTDLSFTETTDVQGTLVDNAATALPGAGFGSDVQLVCTTPLLSSSATVLTLAGLDSQASPVSKTGIATIAPPAQVADQGFNFQRGFATDLIQQSPAAAPGGKWTDITALTSIQGGSKGASYDLYRLPALSDYVLIGCTTDKEFNTRGRAPKGVDCQMQADAFIKAGKTPLAELMISGKLKTFADGLARIDGHKVTIMLEGVLDGQVLGDRLVFTQFRANVRPSLPDGDGEATVKAEGKYSELFMFAAPYSA